MCSSPQNHEMLCSLCGEHVDRPCEMLAHTSHRLHMNMERELRAKFTALSEELVQRGLLPPSMLPLAHGDPALLGSSSMSDAASHASSLLSQRTRPMRGQPFAPSRLHPYATSRRSLQQQGPAFGAASASSRPLSAASHASLRSCNLMDS